MNRLEEQRRRLPEASYRRLFLNEWTEAEDRLTTIDDLQACVTLDGPQAPQPGNRYIIGLDLGLKADLTAAVACHLDEEISLSFFAPLLLARVEFVRNQLSPKDFGEVLAIAFVGLVGVAGSVFSILAARRVTRAE